MGEGGNEIMRVLSRAGYCDSRAIGQAGRDEEGNGDLTGPDTSKQKITRWAQHGEDERGKHHAAPPAPALRCRG